MKNSSEQLAVSGEQYRARHEAEEEARHVMGAVPWIELAAIVFVMLCAVAALAVLLR